LFIIEAFGVFMVEGPQQPVLGQNLALDPQVPLNTLHVVPGVVR
jgi:hypothetical protein